MNATVSAVMSAFVKLTFFKGQSNHNKMLLGLFKESNKLILKIYRQTKDLEG